MLEYCGNSEHGNPESLGRVVIAIIDQLDQVAKQQQG